MICLQSLLHQTRPDRGTTVFPRLWVRITCSSWPGTLSSLSSEVHAMSFLRSHREKRTSKSTSGHNRHTVAGPLGRVCELPCSAVKVQLVPPGAEIPGPPNWESVRAPACEARRGRPFWSFWLCDALCIALPQAWRAPSLDNVTCSTAQWRLMCSRSRRAVGTAHLLPYRVTHGSVLQHVCCVDGTGMAHLLCLTTPVKTKQETPQTSNPALQRRISWEYLL